MQGEELATVNSNRQEAVIVQAMEPLLGTKKHHWSAILFCRGQEIVQRLIVPKYQKDIQTNESITIEICVEGHGELMWCSFHLQIISDFQAQIG